MIAYQAYSKHGHVTAPTAQQAANEFFTKFATARKCNITEGELDGHFFTVKYGNRFSACGMPKSWKDITKKQIGELPNEAAQ